MAYSLHDLKVIGMETAEILSCRIEGKTREHTSLSLRTYVENEETIVYEMLYCQPLEVHARGEAGEEVLFCGVISNVQIHHLADVSILEIEGKSASWLMDITKKSRSFQNQQMRYAELVAEVLKDYPGSNMLYAAQDAPTGSLILQYEETDWTFLKRVMSKIGATITPESRHRGIAVYAGVPALEGREISYQIKTMEKDMDTYYYLKANGRQVQAVDFTRYMISSRELLGIFEQVAVEGVCLTVDSFQYLFEGEGIEGIYTLQMARGLVKAEIYPMQLIGAALMGKVVNVSGDRIQAALEIDGGVACRAAFWFSYSTMSASPNGSGWYCMPEIGDDVRIYFPSKHETEAIALSAVSGYERPESGDDCMGDPNSRYLRTKSGQELALAPGHMKLSCAGGKAALMVKSDGSISITAANSVHLTAEEKIVLHAKEKMILHAQDRIELQSTEGGSISLADSKAVFHGTTVNLD